MKITTSLRESGVPPWLSVLLRRGAQAVSVALLVSAACFAIVHTLPGDLAYRIAAGRYGYDQVSVAAAEGVRRELGLEEPAWRQLLSWFGNVAQLDLGTSLVTRADVAAELTTHLWGTLQLAGASLGLALLLGLPLGAVAAAKPNGAVDRLMDLWIAGTRALPPFLLGLVLIVVFSVHLGVLPAAAHGGSSSLVLPAATLAVGLSGLFARVTRDTVDQIQQADFVRFAETKGLGRRMVFLRHVVRNTSVTVVAYLGVQALLIVEGVVVVESLFAWPGLGHALVHAIFWRDIPVLQASVLALAVLVVAINTVVDLAALALDPRPRARQVVT
jgi:peptide/nickel transport system permease protein